MWTHKIKIVTKNQCPRSISHDDVSLLGPVPSKDMHTPLKSGPFFMKDAHSAESNEKSCIRFFRFLVFELLTGRQICNHSSTKKNRSKFSGKIRIDLTMMF